MACPIYYLYFFEISSENNYVLIYVSRAYLQTQQAYSFFAILMGGICGSSTDSSKVDQVPLQVRMSRLKHQIDSNVEKTRAAAIKQEKQLIAEFKKPKSFRTIAAENGIANSITIKINKIHVYEVVRYHIQKLLTYKNHISSIQLAKKSLYPSFGVILYAQSILKDQGIDYFCSAIRKNFPDAKQCEDQQIDSDIMKHHKKNDLPTVSMTNQYVLKLVNQQSLDINEINKIGHNYRFGA